MKRFLLLSISWIFFIASPSWGVDFKWLSVHKGLVVDRFNIDEPYTGEITGEIVGQAKDGRLVGVVTFFVSDGKIRCKQFPNNCEVFATNGTLLASADNYQEAIIFLDSKKKAAERATEKAAVIRCEQERANWRAATACRTVFPPLLSVSLCFMGSKPPPCEQYWGEDADRKARLYKECTTKWGAGSGEFSYVYDDDQPSCIGY